MITNNSEVGIVMAVWAVDDDYDHQDMENYISVTTLIRPIKQIILGSRVTVKPESDVVDYFSRAFGNSFHASVEKAWVKNYRKNLAKLGYSKEVIDSILINPEDNELFEGCIPVYIEQRSCKQIEGFVVGGKYDMVAEGILHDNKSTSAYTWVFGGRDDEHKLQGSLYKWLNPTRIYANFIRINYLFTDWQKMLAVKPTYPQKRCEVKDVTLMDIPETEAWVRTRLQDLKRLWNEPEEMIPECTDEELWRSEPVFKYYADATKTNGKSTKNFDDGAEAYAHKASKGGVGAVVEFPGEVKRCGYCPAAEICQQRKRYFPD